MSNFASYPSLIEKTVLITGGGSGIGASLVEHFVAQNAKVAFVDIEEEISSALVERLAERFPHAPLYLPCDVTDTAQLHDAIADINIALGSITVLVNNAGNDDRHDFHEITPEYWDQRMEVNLKHQFFAAQGVYEAMKTAGGGSIINMSSITWVMGQGGYACYTTAKSAVIGLTRSLSRDFGLVDIRVNSVLPGWIMTDRQVKLWLTLEGEEEINQRQALKHKLYPEDVSRMILFLAADDSQLITGQSFIVDGGWV